MYNMGTITALQGQPCQPMGTMHQFSHFITHQLEPMSSPESDSQHEVNTQNNSINFRWQHQFDQLWYLMVN